MVKSVLNEEPPPKKLKKYYTEFFSGSVCRRGRPSNKNIPDYRFGVYARNMVI